MIWLWLALQWASIPSHPLPWNSWPHSGQTLGSIFGMAQVSHRHQAEFKLNIEPNAATLSIL
jgi:hypothetical protein